MGIPTAQFLTETIQLHQAYVMLVAEMETQKSARLIVRANNGNAQLDNEILARTSPAFRVLYDFIQKINQAGGANNNQTVKGGEKP